MIVKERIIIIAKRNNYIKGYFVLYCESQKKSKINDLDNIVKKSSQTPNLIIAHKSRLDIMLIIIIIKMMMYKEEFFSSFY